MRTAAKFLAALGLGLAATMGPRPARSAQSPQRNPWEKTIAAMEARDKMKPPPKGAIVFAGSSSIRGWDLPKSFPDLQTVNRGFGGSQIADSTEFADRIILPLEPPIVVLYAGDNDIASGKTPQRVCDDFKAFLKTIHDALPKTRIVFLAIKPSIARWRLVEKMREANRLIKAVIDGDDRLVYVDVDAPMIGEDGKPLQELFVKDGLHLSAKGYELWTGLVRPHLGTR